MKRIALFISTFLIFTSQVRAECYARYDPTAFPNPEDVLFPDCNVPTLGFGNNPCTKFKRSDHKIIWPGETVTSIFGVVQSGQILWEQLGCCDPYTFRPAWPIFWDVEFLSSPAAAIVRQFTAPAVANHITRNCSMCPNASPPPVILIWLRRPGRGF